MANTYTWINTSNPSNPSSGTTDDWSDTGAWQSNGVTPAGPPVAGDTVLINQSDGMGDPYTVTITYGEFAAADTVTLDYAGALLQLQGTLDLGSGLNPGMLNLQNGTFQLQGGTLANATIYEAGGGFLAAVPDEYSTPNFGTLNNVTVVGDLSLASSTGLTIENGLTVFASNGFSPGALTIGEAPYDEGQAGLDFVAAQTLDNVTVTFGNPVDTAYPSYIQADDLTLGSNATIDVVGAAVMRGTFIDNAAINVERHGSLDLSNAVLTGNAEIAMDGTLAAVSLPDGFAGTITGLGGTNPIDEDNIGVVGVTGADTAVVNASNQLAFYDSQGNLLATSVQFAPGNYTDDNFAVYQNGPGNGTDVTINSVPTGGGVANTFEWDQGLAAANEISDFNAAANWLVNNASPVAGPAAASDVDFNNGGSTYLVTGFGVVNYLSAEQDNVTFNGGLNVSNLLITSAGAAVTLSDGNFTLGAVSLQSPSGVTLTDTATVTVGTPGIYLSAGSTLTNDTTLSGALTNYGTVSGTGTYDQTSGSIENYGSFTQGSLEISGGLFTNNANMTITGNLDVTTGGELQVNNPILVDGNFYVSGGVANLNGPVNVLNGYYEGDDTTLGPGGTLTAGTIEITAAGHFTLDGGSTDGGGFYLAGGILELASGNLDLPVTSDETGTLQIDAGTTMTVSGSVSSGMAVDFAGGAAATLSLDNAAGFGGTLRGFGPGDAIQFGASDVSFVSYDVDPAGVGVLTLDVDGTNSTLQFADGSAFDAKDFVVGPGPGNIGTTLTPLCFCIDTLIATPAGQVKVQNLAVGDIVMTFCGVARPITWIGTGRVLATRGRRNAATPIVVRKGALADNVPHHDLRVTKGHSFYFDGVLIPVEFLVNHRSIEWDDQAQEVKLYHIELETHDVLLANGAPAESYRDDGNRWLFQNANSGWDEPAKAPCGPVLTGGPLVDRVWRRLLERAGRRPGVPLTDDPDLSLMVDGKRICSASRHGSVHIFALPEVPACVRITSRAGAPAELGLARDPRVLGVAIRQIAVRQGVRFRVMEAADPTLVEGFHPFEPANGYRWTGGDAVLPAAIFEGFDGPVELVLHVGGTTQYPLFSEAIERAAA